MKQHPETSQTEIPADAVISNPSRPLVRLQGSHSSQQPFRAVARSLPRRDDHGRSLPNDKPPLPPPPPPVSTPDLALQFSPCLPAELDDALVSAIGQAIDPNADVRTVCLDGTQRIGIWLRPFVNTKDNQARDRGLERLNIIKAGETLAFFINSALIRRQALDAWNAAPKQRIIIGSVETPEADAGAGCAAAALIPREILIPDFYGQKVVASYSRLEVNSGGIFAGGSFIVIPRSPQVTISGPSQISVIEGVSLLDRSYSLVLDDLLPPLQFAWSGEGVALNPTAQTTGFRFNLVAIRAGQAVNRRVTVRVTDAEGLTGLGELVVEIYVIPDMSDDNFPPVCRVKPWLEVCQEPLAYAASLRRGEQP